MKDTFRGKWQGSIKVYMRGETNIEQFGLTMNAEHE